MLVLGEVSIPEQGVRLIQDQVVAYLNDQPIAGEGTLAIAESCVTWISRAREGRGFSLSYPSIIMHAVCTDVSSFPHEHVLVVADAGKAGPTSGRGGSTRRSIPLYTEEEAAAAAEVQLAHQELQAGDGVPAAEGDDESDDGNLLLRFVPCDMGALDTIYKEMADCQELNPEEEDMEEDEDEEEYGEEDDGVMMQIPETGGLGPGWYTADNLDNVQLSDEGRANLERMMRNARNGGHGTNGHHHDDDEHEMDEE